MFEDKLERTGTGFIVGDKASYADFGLMYVGDRAKRASRSPTRGVCDRFLTLFVNNRYCLFELAEEDVVPDFASRFDLPLLGDFLHRMTGRPKIHEFLYSERRMPRYKRPGYTYCGGIGAAAPDERVVTGSELSDAFKDRTQT